MSDLRTIATIRKNAAEEVRVALTSFNGHDLIDLRVFAEFSTSGGERKATKKGISLNRDKLPELIAALQAAQRESSR